MRIGGGRLSLLVILLALLTVAPPASAGGQGDVGVADGVVVVRAREVLPGAADSRGGGGGDDDGDPESVCVWDVAIDDDLYVGIYTPEGERLYSDSGRWFQKDCGAGAVEINGFFVAPEGGGFSLPDMLAQAMDALDPSLPIWGSSPDGVDVPMVVQMPTWLWVESSYWSANSGVRVETPSGRIWAEALAVPTSAVWHVGAEDEVLCDGPGEPFAAESGEPSCAHEFEHSTAGTEGLFLSVTVNFDAMGSTNLNPTPVVAGQISRTSDPVVVTVGEIQAIETN